MENFQVQLKLKNRIIAASIPTNLSSDILESESNTHLDDGSTSTDKGFLVSENNTCHVGVLTPTNGMLTVTDSRGFPAVKSNADKGEACQTTDESSLGEACQRTDMDSESNTYVDDGLTASPVLFGCLKDGKAFLRKFDGSVTTSVVVKDERTDVCHPDSESNTCRDDKKEAISRCVGIMSQAVKPISRKDSGWAVSESNTHQAAVLGGGFTTTTEGEGVSSQKIKKGIAESENNTHLDDGSTLTDKGFLVSENNTCHVDVSTTTDGIVNEAISKDWEDETPQRTDVPFLDSKSNTPQEDADSGVSQEAERAVMESFPLDIVQEILSRVPAELVFECKLVCKKWVALTRGINFAKMHLSNQINHLNSGDKDNENLVPKVESCLVFACRIDDPDEFRTLLFHGGRVGDRVRVDEKYIYNQNLKRIHHPPMHQDPMCNHLVGSCNGLVCAFQLHNTILDPIYICNPLTREYVYLPELVVRKEDVQPYRVVEGEADMSGNTACGFGYVRSTNEYKVVRIHYLGFKEGTVEVYTLGSGCGWRGIGKVPYRLSTSGGGIGTYANDAICWTSYNKIVSFDLAKEEFRLLSVPPRLENRGKEDRCGLVALGGHLCLYIDDRSRVQIWSLMRSSDSKETWHMEFSVNYEAAVADTRKNEFKPILLTKDGELIFLYAESALYFYDTKTKNLKMISNEASADHFEVVEAITHVNTFASLQAIGENSKRFTVHQRGIHTSRGNVIDELDRVDIGEKIDMTRFSLRSGDEHYDITSHVSLGGVSVSDD